MHYILHFIGVYDWAFELVASILLLILYFRNALLLRRYRILTDDEIARMSGKERREAIVDILTDGLLEWLKKQRKEQLGPEEERDLVEHLSKSVKDKGRKKHTMNNVEEKD